MSTFFEAGRVGECHISDAVRQIIDADEIRRLKYTYCRAADALDAEGMLAVLTDDCVVDLSGGRGGAVSGIDAARKLYSGALSKYAASSHSLSNMDVVFESADTARLESYLYAWQRYQAYPDVRDRHRWARYRDVFRRDADGWKQSKLVLYVGGEITPEDVERSGETTGLPLWR